MVQWCRVEQAFVEIKSVVVLDLTFLQTCIYNAKSLDLSFRRAKEVFNNSVNGEFLR